MHYPSGTVAAIYTAMDTTRQLRDHLLESNRLSSAEFARAQHFGHARMTTLSKALVTLGLLDYEALGEALSELHGYPYRPLTTAAVSPQARAMISRTCASNWHVIPVAFDSYANCLTLATATPEQMVKMERINRFLMQPYDLAFTIASDAEIDQAIVQQYDLAAVGVDSTHSPLGKRKLPGLNQLVEESNRQSVAVRKVKRVRDQKASGITHDGTVSAVSGDSGTLNRALISAVRLLILRDLAREPARILEIQTRVRYGLLLATRLQLGPAEINGTILATWLSAYRGHADDIKQLQTPYPLEEILVASANSTPSARVEALILSLVMSYQALLDRDSDVRRDVSRLRTSLRQVWSAVPEHHLILETFLQLLMDEDFLTHAGTASGSVLIVGPSELRSSHLGPPLTRQGYNVVVAPDVASARRTVEETVPNVMLIDAQLPSDEVMTLCQEVRKHPAGNHMIVIILADEPAMRRAALYMRAGADDILSRPLDLELLMLKLQRLLPEEAAPRRHGVRGSLEDMSFPDMLQILSAGGKNVVITLEYNARVGHLYLQGGNVIHAVLNDIEGDEAFHGLIGWTTGHFEMEPCENFPKPTITTPTMSLLLEAARRYDERSESEADETTGQPQSGVMAPEPSPSMANKADA